MEGAGPSLQNYTYKRGRSSHDEDAGIQSDIVVIKAAEHT